MSVALTRCLACGRFDPAGLAAGSTWTKQRLCARCAQALDDARTAAYDTEPLARDPELEAIVEDDPEEDES